MIRNGKNSQKFIFASSLSNISWLSNAACAFVSTFRLAWKFICSNMLIQRSEVRDTPSRSLLLSTIQFLRKNVLTRYVLLNLEIFTKNNQKTLQQGSWTVSLEKRINWSEITMVWKLSEEHQECVMLRKPIKQKGLLKITSGKSFSYSEE